MKLFAILFTAGMLVFGMLGYRNDATGCKINDQVPGVYSANEFLEFKLNKLRTEPLAKMEPDKVLFHDFVKSKKVELENNHPIKVYAATEFLEFKHLAEHEGLYSKEVSDRVLFHAFMKYKESHTN